jgi:hypothetical protein
MLLSILDAGAIGLPVAVVLALVVGGTVAKPATGRKSVEH